jgi:hypothetical protein
MNSSAWDKFRKQQTAEREQLRRLVSGMRDLLAKCRITAPTEIELAALATLLHSFYTGLENVFKRVSIELDSERITGDAWHRDLLQRMREPSPHRAALLSKELYDSLSEYLRFRHVFRNAYSFDLDWQKMAPLVLRLQETFQKFEESLDNFLKESGAD